MTQNQNIFISPGEENTLNAQKVLWIITCAKLPSNLEDTKSLRLGLMKQFILLTAVLYPFKEFLRENWLEVKQFTGKLNPG